MSADLKKPDATFDQYGIQFTEPLGGAPTTAEIGKEVFGKILSEIKTGLGAGYPIFELWFEPRLGCHTGVV